MRFADPFWKDHVRTATVAKLMGCSRQNINQRCGRYLDHEGTTGAIECDKHPETGIKGVRLGWLEDTLQMRER